MIEYITKMLGGPINDCLTSLLHFITLPSGLANKMYDMSTLVCATASNTDINDNEVAEV